MKLLATTAMLFGIFATTQAFAESTEIFPAGSRPTAKGPEANFTGSAMVDMLYMNNEHTTNSGGLCDLRTGLAFGLAYPPCGTGPDRHLGIRLGLGGRQSEAPDPIRRRGVDTTWREALARRDREKRHEPYRRVQRQGRQGSRLDGKSHGRTVP